MDRGTAARGEVLDVVGSLALAVVVIVGLHPRMFGGEDGCSKEGDEESLVMHDVKCGMDVGSGDF